MRVKAYADTPHGPATMLFDLFLQQLLLLVVVSLYCNIEDGRYLTLILANILFPKFESLNRQNCINLCEFINLLYMHAL